MYHKIHRRVDVDSVDTESGDTPQEPQYRDERDVEELPGEARRPVMIAEE